MSAITFKRAIKSAETIDDKIIAYSDEFGYSLMLASKVVEQSKVIPLDFKDNENTIKLVKVRLFGDYFNLVISKEGYSTQRLEEITEYKLHFAVLVSDSTFRVLKGDIIGEVDEETTNFLDKEIKHCSKLYEIYKIADKMIVSSLSYLLKEKKVQRKFDVITDYNNIGFDINKIYNIDCMEAMKLMGDNSVDFILTDIPYDGVSKTDSSKNRINSKALRVLDKEEADILTFDLKNFLKEVIRISSNSICIFCGNNQVSDIFNYFRENNLTARIIVWEKAQFSPMNGDIIYGTNVELAVWGKKHNNGVFNAFCKGTVFKYSSGKSKIHPTEKNIDLFKELILDNTNEGMLVLDPCIGSGTTAKAAQELGRNFIGFEKEEKWYNVAINRLGGLDGQY